MTWETVIGLETHVELSTRTKLFCGCSTAFGGAPNTRCCPVCAGLPGALPVLNGRAVEYAVRAGLALGCKISPDSRFDRKNYCYPDLPKAYQITQFYRPIAVDGAVTLSPGRTVRIRELHLEEDAGKLLHDPHGGATRVDYNRCGVPLIEIVTQPDFRSGAEAAAYLERLRTDLKYLGVSDCKLQEGSLRCDVNLSVRPKGSRELGVRTELKNLGSFRAVVRASDYEARRQIALLESGDAVEQETRRWDEEQGVSLAMRSKEERRDYRYFPEPDLPPLLLEEGYVEAVRRTLRELSAEKAARFGRDYGLLESDIRTLTAEKELADFFEAVVDQGAEPREAANWVLGQVLRRRPAEGLALSPQRLAELIALVDRGTVNRNTAVAVFDAVYAGNGDPAEYVRAHGLGLISEAGAVEFAVRRVLSAHPGPVKDLLGGREKAFAFLVGQVMRELKGRADPGTVNQTLREALLREAKE